VPSLQVRARLVSALLEIALRAELRPCRRGRRLNGPSGAIMVPDLRTPHRSRRVAKQPDTNEPERYEDIVKRLDDVVTRLESGQLSLEDSLKAFEEGVGLVRKGEARLTEAEKRVELLLSESGEKAAFDPERPRSEGGQQPERKPARPAAADDEDVPF
jgi:exodeoxyribonuclease VII small subunit